MKRTDFLIIASILAFALLIGVITFLPKIGTNVKEKYISVQIDGKEVDRLKWDKKTIGHEFRYEGIEGYNIVRVNEDSVEMFEADCPDQICVHDVPIKEVGDLIVCLPHRILIEIKEDKASNDIDAVLR